MRPSSAAAVGNPTVNESTARPTIWSAPGCTPARSRSVVSGTPNHFAVPISGPPTSFETHDSVTYSSTIGIASTSANVSSNGWSTRPCTFSVQWSGSTCGTAKAVSMR